jgi:hypothetical protein
MDSCAIRTGAVYRMPDGRLAVPITEEITLGVPDGVDVVDALADFLNALVEAATDDE